MNRKEELQLDIQSAKEDWMSASERYSKCVDQRRAADTELDMASEVLNDKRKAYLKAVIAHRNHSYSKDGAE